MNRKQSICMIPVLATVVAVMTFALAPNPMALAEFGSSEMSPSNWMNQNNNNHHPPMAHKAVEVDEFVGSVQAVDDDADIRTLRDQITVSLSKASSGLDDVIGARVGFAENENGDKYLVWILIDIEGDPESETVTTTIHIVDVANAENTATITKEFDHSLANNGFGGDNGDDRFNHEGSGNPMMDMIQQKLSESTGDADIDEARATFAEKLQELRTAMQDGDADKVSELREELNDLRSELGNNPFQR